MAHGGQVNVLTGYFFF